MGFQRHKISDTLNAKYSLKYSLFLNCIELYIPYSKIALKVNYLKAFLYLFDSIVTFPYLKYFCFYFTQGTVFLFIGSTHDYMIQ